MWRPCTKRYEYKGNKQKQKKKKKLILTPEESESQIEEEEIEKEQEVPLQRKKRKQMTVSSANSVEDPTPGTATKAAEKELAPEESESHLEERKVEKEQGLRPSQKKSRKYLCKGKRERR